MTGCAWCRSELATTRRDARFCSKRCRQAAFRVRRQSVALERTTTPLRIAYADPPYPGLAKRYYGNEATYGGEVDHRELVDLYPGTGIVGRVWASLSADADTSPRGATDTPRPGLGDTSLELSADTSSAGVADAFGAAVGDGSNWGIDDPDDWGRMTSLAPRGVGDTSQEYSDDASLGADGVPTPETLKVGTR